MLTTSRLHLRQLTLADAPFILELFNTPLWIKYIGDRHIHSLHEAKNYLSLRIISAYRKGHFGYYGIEQLDTHQLIGISSFIQRPYLSYPDIGFALLPDAIGQGYAYEATAALMRHAEQQWSISALQASTLPDNQSSIRLLQKLGFSKGNTFSIPGETEELLLFSNF